MAEIPGADKKVALEDILGYKAETYLTEEETKLIKSAFGGRNGSKLLHVIRKIMTPTVLDLELPIEEMGKDMFLQRIDFVNLNAEETKAIVMGLQLSTKVLLGGLVQLKQMANISEESAADRASRMQKDSAK